MLLSLDNLMHLNLAYIDMINFLILYWILSGILSQFLLMKIDKFLLNKNYYHTIETMMSRRILYFIFGGAILPMLILIVPALLILSRLFKLIESKRNGNKI
jgi:hypothetical protein